MAARQPDIRRTDLQQHDLGVPGREVVQAGDVLFVPAGAIHAVTNVGDGNAAELATHVVEKGKPILTLVE